MVTRVNAPFNQLVPPSSSPALPQVVYTHLETMLRSYKSDEQAETLCKGLHELGFWVCLPHLVVERAYSDRNVPDRYCTVALMAENRHILKVGGSRSSSSGGGGGGSTGRATRTCYLCLHPPPPSLICSAVCSRR